MKIQDIPEDIEPRVGDIIEIEQGDVCFEVRIIGITADGYLCEQDNVEGAVLLEGLDLVEDDASDIEDFLRSGGKIQKLPYKNARKEKSAHYRLASRHIGGSGHEQTKGKLAGLRGRAAAVNVSGTGKAVVGEDDIEEAGPFSYGYKPPRKGSVAYWAEKKRKEQEKGKPPIEPKDQMVGVAKVTKGVSEGTESQYMAARYIDEFGDGDHWYVKGTPDVIKKFVLLANSLEDETVKGTEYEPGKGMMGGIHAELGNDAAPQWTIVPARNLESIKPIGDKVLQRLMRPNLADGAQEFMSELLWAMEAKGLALVHDDSQPGVAEGSGKNVVKSIKVGNFRHDLVDTGMGWQVRIYNGDELYDTGMSKNSEQKGLAALEDAVAYTEKQTRTKRQGVSEAKSLKKRVRVVQGEHAGKTGWIREIKHGIHSTAPKRYYVDIDGGGQADNLPASALRLLKDQSDDQKGMAEGGHDDQFSLSGKMPATDRIPQDSTQHQDRQLAMGDKIKQQTIAYILKLRPEFEGSDLELATTPELIQMLRDIQSGKMTEAEYQGRKVALGKPMAGDVAKRKVYVRKPNGKVVKVNFGDKNMKIKKSNPKRRKSFRARHNCANPGPRWKARYWSCRAW